jgi:ribonucleoside-diphosphate reductase alpha chain
MLGLRYDSAAAREAAAAIARTLRDQAYRASVALAREKGAFPLFDADQYLAGAFAQRLPEDIRADIRAHGIRNSHLLSIAPTGTISLAFADNASNGIEPAFAWTYNRQKREADGTRRSYVVQDHAHRLYRHLRGNNGALPEAFVSAAEIAALDHAAMLKAVQPFVDTSISKTVNVPADYPYENFRDLYLEAWKAGLKGLATYRPNVITGAVLSADVAGTEKAQPLDLDESDPDRRLSLEEVPQPALASLRWPKRPDLPDGNPSWTYMITHPSGIKFALFIGQVDDTQPYPFEVWVNGAEQPRGLGALAKSLSMDMRAQDRAWLKKKLDALMKAAGDDGFALRLPGGETVQVPSLVAGVAALIDHRVRVLGAYQDMTSTPVLDAIMSPKEPKTGTDGTMSWTVDILNPSTGDDFVLGLKELVLPGGQRRPYSVWLAGEYPRALDGLCKVLSLDMRVIDPAWIGAKLRGLLDFPEPQGDFLAWVPGERRQQTWASTEAYMARLMIHRYAMLGILDEEGYPLEPMGVLDLPEKVVPLQRAAGAQEVTPGKRCQECGNYAVIRRDGCDFCTACGALGMCG